MNEMAIKSAMGVIKTHLVRRKHMSDCFCAECSADKFAISALQQRERLIKALEAICRIAQLALAEIKEPNAKA